MKYKRERKAGITLIIFTIVILQLSACTETKITSRVVNTDKVENIDNIAYAFYSDRTMGKASSHLETKSLEIYRANNINFDLFSFSFLENGSDFSLDTALTYAKRKNFDYLLLLNSDAYNIYSSSSSGYFQNNTYMGGGSSSTIRHGIKAILLSVADTTDLWRAEIDITSGGSGNSEQIGKSLAKQLCVQLQKDGFLPPTFFYPY